MKKHIYIASIFFASLFAGCDDFLTLESPDFSTDRFWRDSLDIEMGLSATYGQLENRTNNYSFAEVKFPVEAFREDVMVTGADVANYPNWGELANFSYTNGNSQFKSYWMNNYNGINYANNVFFGLDKVQKSDHPMTQKTYDMLFGEASFLRGYYHMKLLLNWEKIIIRNAYMTTEGETHKALASREDAWDFIITELKNATKLPAVREPMEVGRATSAAAYAYIGWAYLTRAYETPEKKDEYLGEAVKAFNEIKDYSLEKDFLSMFNGTNKNSKESLLELQFTETTEGGAYHKHTVHKFIASGFNLGGWDEIRPSDMILNEYKKEGRIATTGDLDSRAYASAFFEDPYFEVGKKVYGRNYTDILVDKKTGIAYTCFRKYIPETKAGLMNDFASTNMPLMRYANVMLMKAEALNELNHPEQAIPLIDEIRRIHGDMPAMTGTSQEDVRAQIEHERLMEFAVENFRWYDLRRWGKLSEAMKTAGRLSFDENENSFYPIPLMEVQANNEID